MWNLPGSGIEPVSFALQGRFLTPGPPGKALEANLMQRKLCFFVDCFYRRDMIAYLDTDCGGPVEKKSVVTEKDICNRQVLEHTGAGRI